MRRLYIVGVLTNAGVRSPGCRRKNASDCTTWPEQGACPRAPSCSRRFVAFECADASGVQWSGRTQIKKFQVGADAVQAGQGFGARSAAGALLSAATRLCSNRSSTSRLSDDAPRRVAEQARNIQPAEIRFDSAWRRQQSAHEPCTRSRPVGSKLRSVPAVANAKNAMLVLWLKLTVRQRLIILVRPATARLAGGLETSRRSSPPPRPHGRRRDLHEIMGGGGRRWQTPKLN